MNKWCMIIGALTLGLKVTSSSTLAIAAEAAAPQAEGGGYFVQTYSQVLAGKALARQCNFFSAWQKKLMRHHTKALEPMMTQHLSTGSLNEATARANKLTLANANCGDGALTIADNSLFAAHSLLHGRPAGLDPQNLSAEMQEFLGWANVEIGKHEQRRQALIAARQRKALELEQTYVHFTASTEGYYLERLCQHLAGDDARAYWKIIADAHKQAVANHGVKKVRNIQDHAASKAKTLARSCGSETRKTVLAGYEIARKGFKVAALAFP